MLNPRTQRMLHAGHLTTPRGTKPAPTRRASTAPSRRRQQHGLPSPPMIDSCPMTPTIAVPMVCQTTCANIGLTTSYIRSYASYAPGCYTATQFVTKFTNPARTPCAVPWCALYYDWTLVPSHNPACPTTPTTTRTLLFTGCSGCSPYSKTSTEGAKPSLERSW